jgi:hypothetical protein
MLNDTCVLYKVGDTPYVGPDADSGPGYPIGTQVRIIEVYPEDNHYQVEPVDPELHRLYRHWYYADYELRTEIP